MPGPFDAFASLAAFMADNPLQGAELMAKFGITPEMLGGAQPGIITGGGGQDLASPQLVQGVTQLAQASQVAPQAPEIQQPATIAPNLTPVGPDQFMVQGGNTAQRPEMQDPYAAPRQLEADIRGLPPQAPVTPTVPETTVSARRTPATSPAPTISPTTPAPIAPNPDLYDRNPQEITQSDQEPSAADYNKDPEAERRDSFNRYALALAGLKGAQPSPPLSIKGDTSPGRVDLGTGGTAANPQLMQAFLQSLMSKPVNPSPLSALIGGGRRA